MLRISSEVTRSPRYGLGSHATGSSAAPLSVKGAVGSKVGCCCSQASSQPTPDTAAASASNRADARQKHRPRSEPTPTPRPMPHAGGRPMPQAGGAQAGGAHKEQQQQGSCSTALHPSVVTQLIYAAKSLGDVAALLNAPHARICHFHIAALWLKMLELSEGSDEDVRGESRPLPAWHPRNLMSADALDSFEGDWEHDDVEDEYSDDSDDSNDSNEFNPGGYSWTRDQLFSLREQRLRRSSTYRASSSSSPSSSPAPLGVSAARRQSDFMRHLPRSSTLTTPESLISSAALALGRSTNQLASLTMRHADRLEPHVISISLKCMTQLHFNDTRVLDALIKTSTARMKSFKPATIPGMVWACAILKYQPSVAWLDAATSATTSNIDQVSVNQLCTMAYCFGKLRYQPDAAWVTALCGALSIKELSCVRVSDLTRLITGLASMQLTQTEAVAKSGGAIGRVVAAMKTLPTATKSPSSSVSTSTTLTTSPSLVAGLPAAWLASYLEVSAARLATFDASCLCQTITALSSFRADPVLTDRWLVSFYGAAGLLFLDSRSKFTAGHATSVVLALADLNSRPDIAWLNDLLSKTRPSLKTTSCSDLVKLVNGLSLLRFRAGEGWLRSFLSAAFRKLSYFTAAQCCAVLLALTRLGHRPPTLWLSEVSKRLQHGMDELTCQQLSDVLCALAQMGYQPDKSWLAAFEKNTHSRMGDTDSISADGLAEAAWALAQVRYKPQVSWLYSLVLAAYRRLDSFGAAQLSLLFRALPLISQVGVLDELVQICASEATSSMRSRSGSYDEEEEWSFAQAASIGAPAKSSSSTASSSTSMGSFRSGRPASARSFASAAARAARSASGSDTGSRLAESSGGTFSGFFKAKSGELPAPSRSSFLWSGVYLNEGSYDEFEDEGRGSKSGGSSTLSGSTKLIDGSDTSGIGSDSSGSGSGSGSGSSSSSGYVGGSVNGGSMPWDMSGNGNGNGLGGSDAKERASTSKARVAGNRAALAGRLGANASPLRSGDGFGINGLSPMTANGSSGRGVRPAASTSASGDLRPPATDGGPDGGLSMDRPAVAGMVHTVPLNGAAIEQINGRATVPDEEEPQGTVKGQRKTLFANAWGQRSVT